MMYTFHTSKKTKLKTQQIDKIKKEEEIKQNKKINKSRGCSSLTALAKHGHSTSQTQ